jgi:hypothetical protein
MAKGFELIFNAVLLVVAVTYDFIPAARSKGMAAAMLLLFFLAFGIFIYRIRFLLRRQPADIANLESRPKFDLLSTAAMLFAAVSVVLS